PNRCMEMYISVDNLVATGAAYAKQFGMPVNLPLPPNLPPVGMTASTQANTARFDTYIPSQLVQSMIAAGMQMFMALQGGAQPGADADSGEFPYIVGAVDAALCHQDLAVLHQFGHAQGRAQVGLEGAQVAVVDAQQAVALVGEADDPVAHAHQVVQVVHLDQA